MNPQKIATVSGCLAMALSAGCVLADQDRIAQAIDSYVSPYVESNNFSGNVFLKKKNEIIFHKAYGLADRERKISNTGATPFHIASVSMQFTAAAILRLVDQGAISLDSNVGEIVPDVAGGDKIKIRDLLRERSGLPDINELPDYDELLQQHQTPNSLVAKIRGRPLLFEPGSQFLHEEHSAYNLLALIVETKTKLSFRAAVQQLVFEPMKLNRSFVDDDLEMNEVARGYEPVGISGLEPAKVIHWSGKTGNGSVCATTADLNRWIDSLFEGHALTKSSKDVMLDTTQREGYGWFKGTSKRFNETSYYMNGRAPGFASFILYLPREALTVVVLSNIYSSATTVLGNDIASIALGLPYEPFQAGEALSDPTLTASTGWFQFGADFYQKNAKVQLFATGTDLSLRWPSGDVSPLIPTTQDHFRDRNYWELVSLERDPSGKPATLVYGRFRGGVVESN